jgi:hypothetical protein
MNMKKFLLLLAISALAYIRPLGGQTVTIGGTALRKVTQNLAPTLTDGANSVPSATAVKNFGSTTLWGKTLPMTVANGDGFRYNANTQAWEAVPYGTATLVGDVTGSIGANTVTALRGKPLPTNPANGDGLRYNSTTQAWEAVPYGAGSLEGDVTGSIVANTVEAIQNDVDADDHRNGRRQRRQPQRGKQHRPRSQQRHQLLSERQIWRW